MLQLMYKKLPWKPSVVSLHIFLQLLFQFFLLLFLFTDENICEFILFLCRHFLFVFIVIHKVGYQETVERSGKEQEKNLNIPL